MPKMSNLLRTRLIAPYQHDGVSWLVKRELATLLPGGILCDEMGLGKTVQMLATMLSNPQPHTLIIAPKSVVGQWCSEIKRFAPSLTTYAFDGAKRALPKVLPDIVVAPYSVLAARPGALQCPLLAVEWNRVVLDEGHEIRNAKSKTHIACISLRSEIRWILTGTPIFNSIKDFVSLCAFVGIPRSHVQGYTDEVRSKYVLRRTKEDVSKHNKRLELPPCDFQNLELDMFDDEQQLYDEVFDRARDIVRSIIASGAQNMRQMDLLEALLRARQVMVWPQLYLDGIAIKEDLSPVLWTGRSKKLETLVEMIVSHPKEKSLVFTQFMGEMNEIHKRLNALGLPVFRIDGGVDKDQREERINNFKMGAPNAVFLIQIKAGGVGLNLQQATRVYIMAPSWNPATELQAIGRAHRTGQTQKVTVRRLIYSSGGAAALPSVEQSIMALQESKARVCAEVLNDPRLATQVPNVSKTKMNIQALKKIFAL